MPHHTRAIAVLALVFASTSNCMATNTFCAVIEKTADGFVSLRSGPGVENSIVGKILPDNLLWIGSETCRSDFGKAQCSPNGRWIFAERVFKPPATPLPNLKGWINATLIRQIACTPD